MKKVGLSLIACCLLLSVVWAQSNLQLHRSLVASLPNQMNHQLKSKQQNQKAIGDTLWSDDFGSGILSCWTTVNNNPSGASWQWSTTYDKGPLTQSILPIQSTSKGNGFMMLPMDSVAMNRFPGPITNSQFEGCVAIITPKPALELRLQQFYRLCCAGGNILMQVDVSKDNFQTFDSYDLFTMRPSFSNPVPNPELVSINVSKTLSGEDTAYFRFLMNGASHYFWMIDDLALVEVDPQTVVEAVVEIDRPYAFKSFPTVSPLNYAERMQFVAQIENSSNDTLSNAQLFVEVVELANSSVVYSDSTWVNPLGRIEPLLTDTTVLDSPLFMPQNTGAYRVDFSTSSTQFANDDTVSFFFEKSVDEFGRDYNSPTSKYGPANYFVLGSFGGTVNGDQAGLLYSFDQLSDMNITNKAPISLSFYVSDDSANIGSVIRPVIWEFDSTSSLSNIVVGSEVASSMSTTTITAAQLDSWQTFTLDTGLLIRQGFSYRQYIAGWEMVSGTTNGSTFSVCYDSTASEVTFPHAAFMNFAHAPTFGWATTGKLVPMIRMQLHPNVVGFEEQKTTDGFAIQPNPSNGSFRLLLNEPLGTSSMLRIYGLNGQEVYQRQLNLKSSIIELDLSHLSEGVYILSLEDGLKTVQQKFVIRK